MPMIIKKRGGNKYSQKWLRKRKAVFFADRS